MGMVAGIVKSVEPNFVFGNVGIDIVMAALNKFGIVVAKFGAVDITNFKIGILGIGENFEGEVSGVMKGEIFDDGVAIVVVGLAF